MKGTLTRLGMSGSTTGRLLVAIAAAVLAPFPVATTALAKEEPKANDCGDPYWASTLRCRYTSEGEAPQPNLGDAPADVASIHPFTRVFLTADPSVRSVDGTYPVIYVDKAICTTAGGCGDVPRGGAIDSDKWLITVPGGGACTEETCLDFYADPAERGEMSTAGKPPTKSMSGIHFPDAAINPVFAGYNRVRVEKSSYDRYAGRATYETDDGLRIFNHGFFFMEQTLRALRNGLSYETWVDRDGEPTRVRETLPALAKAEQVVFAGHSGGAHGLVHNIDRLAALLDGFGGFDGDVRAVLDENFVPGIQNESAFTLPSGGDAYTEEWSGVTSGNGVPFAYDGQAFLESGIHTRQAQAWGAKMDASCLAHHRHEDGASWKCNERQHVLFNHITTPFLVKEHLRDPNTEHNNKPFGHTPAWGVPGISFTQQEFAARVLAQASSLIELHATRSELGAAFPTFFVWVNDCENHDGIYDDDVYHDTGIGYQETHYSLREWVERFAGAPRHGGTDWRIVGYPGSDPMTADCLGD